MLTLVAAVLVYDLAYEPTVDLAGGLAGRDAASFGLSLNAMSDTSDENDITLFSSSEGSNENQASLSRSIEEVE